MLVTGVVSSRIGAKRTLLAGLALIIVFSGLAGLSDSIGAIVAFRAGWGLGNALFIATSLAVIVGSAAGGFAGAIVLYETALGVGIACGPLLGALLGSWSQRGPFFGVSVLMAIALVATLVLVPRTPKPAHPASLGEPLRALRHRGLLTMGVTALLALIATFTNSPATLATCVVVAGAFIGINNTLTTQAVMLVAPVERPVASAAYGFLRFIGGGLAPWVAGVLAERFGVPLRSTWVPSPWCSPPACSPPGTACWRGPTRRSRPERRPTPVRPTSTRPSWRRSSRTARARPERGSGRRSRRCTEPAAAGFTSAAEGTRTGWTCTSSPS